ncbi:MAG: hypothetical protein CMM53_11285 [Rhodospirillaceae bacterium]|nr:hypothetical protein [Rhodospirillaceae bacterium]|tara:strand:+ start:413 stop:1108 length:696 start_codon:yes stop_codon:yes gene_type:complete
MIRYEQDGKVGRLYLQRSSHANAFTSEMLERVAELMESAKNEADIIAIHAVGEDFSVGRDRGEPKVAGGPYDTFKKISRVNAAFSDFPGIIISAVKGRIYGFGLGIAMRSDVAIAADSSRFKLDEVSLGFPPMFLMEVILDHLPAKRALDLIISSREFGADEALEMGLISRTARAPALENEVDEFVKLLASRNSNVLKSCKAYLKTIIEIPTSARPNYALVEQVQFTSEDH